MSRKAARKFLAALLANDLIGDNNPVQAVYDGRVRAFNNQSPVVVVSSGGTAPRQQGVRQLSGAYTLTIHVFVLSFDQTPGSSYNELVSEDLLDDISEIIMRVIQNNPVAPGHWSDIEWSEQSETESIEISGAEYRTEVIKILVME